MPALVGKSRCIAEGIVGYEETIPCPAFVRGRVCIHVHAFHYNEMMRLCCGRFNTERYPKAVEITFSVLANVHCNVFALMYIL